MAFCKFSHWLGPLLRHYDVSAPGHLAEIADGDAPHAPGGCPFQAWSVGEALRLAEGVLRASSDALQHAPAAFARAG
jgi:glycogen debranching enzyme